MKIVEEKSKGWFQDVAIVLSSLQNRGIWGSDMQVQVVEDSSNEVKETERKLSIF